MSQSKETSNPKEDDGIRNGGDILLQLRRLNINFVAIDFDQTILSIHTGGVWTGTVPELLPLVRPELKFLIRTIAQSSHRESDGASDGEIHCAVVTFSTQIDVIRGVLSSILDDDSKNNAYHKRIPIRGDDTSWKMPSPELGWWPVTCVDFDLDDDLGKQAHMLSAIQEIEARWQQQQQQKKQNHSNANQSANTPKKFHITKDTTLLIDDDQENIRIARANGVRAIHLDPDHPERFLPDLFRLG